jgi:hypothetical protein
VVQILLTIKLGTNNFFPPIKLASTTMTREHDRPDQNLIIQGARRVHPSKRGLGEDYPVTLAEERLLEQRNKSK